MLLAERLAANIRPSRESAVERHPLDRVRLDRRGMQRDESAGANADDFNVARCFYFDRLDYRDKVLSPLREERIGEMKCKEGFGDIRPK